VNDVESTEMSLSVNNDTSSSHVSSTGGHDDVTWGEWDDLLSSVGGEVELDGVVDLDQWVWVSDGSAVVGDDVWNTTGTELNLLDLEELVGSLLSGDSVDEESSLDVVEDTEVLSGLLNGDNVLESEWVGIIGSDLSVNLDQSLLGDGSDLTTGESEFQSVSEEDGEGETLAELVWTWGRSWGVSSRQLVEHP